MLAQKDDYIKDASNTLYQLSQDEKVRLECEAREDYYRRECRIAKQHEKINELEAQIANMQDTVSEKDAQIANMQDTVSEKDAQIAALKAELEQIKAPTSEQQWL